jgi:endoglucanase
MLNLRMVGLSAVILGLVWGTSVFGDEPVKLARTARFDLTADAQAGSLDDGRVLGNDEATARRNYVVQAPSQNSPPLLSSGGSIARMNWVPEAEQLRGYTVDFPVSLLGWRTASIRFTPARSGTVTLSLMGPWEQASPGLLYRQEVLWDDRRV